jgi:hypothetical protein
MSLARTVPSGRSPFRAGRRCRRGSVGRRHGCRRIQRRHRRRMGSAVVSGQRPTGELVTGGAPTGREMNTDAAAPRATVRAKCGRLVAEEGCPRKAKMDILSAYDLATWPVWPTNPAAFGYLFFGRPTVADRDWSKSHSLEGSSSGWHSPRRAVLSLCSGVAKRGRCWTPRGPASAPVVWPRKSRSASIVVLAPSPTRLDRIMVLTGYNPTDPVHLAETPSRAMGSSPRSAAPHAAGCHRPRCSQGRPAGNCCRRGDDSVTSASVALLEPRTVSWRDRAFFDDDGTATKALSVRSGGTTPADGVVRPVPA